MRKLKLFLLPLAVAALLAVTETTASAQIPVTDASALTQNIRNSIRQDLNAAQELENLVRQVEQAKNIYDQTKLVWNYVDSKFENVKAITQIWNTSERIYRDADLLIQYIKYLESSGLHGVSDVAQLYYSGTTIYDETVELVEKLKTALSSKTSMTQSDRRKVVDEVCNEVQDYCTAMEEMMVTDFTNRITKENQGDAEEILCNMYTATKEGSVAVNVDPEKIIAEISNNTVDTSDDIISFSNSRTNIFSPSTISAAFGIVSVIIGAATVFLLVWGFARRAKGDPQRQDSLWKVFAGCLFSLLILQMIKAAFFDAGGLFN